MSSFTEKIPKKERWLLTKEGTGVDLSVWDKPEVLWKKKKKRAVSGIPDRSGDAVGAKRGMQRPPTGKKRNLWGLGE